MSKGYHSRSPEEFQEFLKKSRESDKGKNRSRLILFFDLILLLFIFAVVARIMNPLAFSGQMESKELPWQDLRLRLTSNKQEGRDLPVFFLFAKNQGANSRAFPEKGETLSVSMSSSEGIRCFSEEWTLPEKKIEPGNTEFFRYVPEENRLSLLPPECSASDKSAWGNLSRAFRKERTRRFDLEIIRDGKKVVLEISNF